MNVDKCVVYEILKCNETLANCFMNSSHRMNKNIKENRTLFLHIAKLYEKRWSHDIHLHMCNVLFIDCRGFPIDCGMRNIDMRVNENLKEISVVHSQKKGTIFNDFNAVTLGYSMCKDVYSFDSFISRNKDTGWQYSVSQIRRLDAKYRKVMDILSNYDKDNRNEKSPNTIISNFFKMNDTLRILDQFKMLEDILASHKKRKESWLGYVCFLFLILMAILCVYVFIV